MGLIQNSSSLSFHYNIDYINYQAFESIKKNGSNTHLRQFAMDTLSSMMNKRTVIARCSSRTNCSCNG